MANSLDQIIRNFFNRITGGDDEETVAETRADQGGLMAPRVVRPRVRPEDVEPIGGAITGAASTGNIALKRFVDGLNEATKIDVSLRPRARPLENTLIDANLSADTLQLKHNMPLYKFQQENETGSDDGSTIKLFSAPTSDAAIDEIEAKTSTIFNKIKEKVKADRRGIEALDPATSAMALGVIPVKGKSYTPTIKDAQIMLDSAGYNVGKIDGIDGPLTQAAVKAFQKDAGFTGRDVDGKFGPKTLAAFIQKNPQITKEELPSKPLSEPLVKRQETDTIKVTKAITRFPYLNKIIDNKYIDLATSTPAKLLMKNIMGLDRNMLMGNTPIPITETSFKEDELQHFRNMWNKYGAGLITKGQQIDSVNDAMNIITGKDKAPYGLPADIRAYYSVGDTNLYQDENGDVILKDIYDYNLYTDYTADPIINPDTGEKEYPRLKTEEFEAPELGFSTAKGIKDTLQAFTSGKIGFLSAAHNLGFLLGSRDYQDPEKDQGTPMLINLGNPETWDEEGKPKASEDIDIMGLPKGEGLMTKPKSRPEDLEPIEPEDSVKIGNLEILMKDRTQIPAEGKLKISLDFNSFAGGKGVEIIIPDDASSEVIAAAKKYVAGVKDFFDANGYGNYKIRDGGKYGSGIYTTSENKKRRDSNLGGVSNTIHTEPFFHQDAKAEKIVDENFESFAKLHLDAFGDLSARMIIPHGAKGNPVGASSKTFGNEYEYGKRMIDTLMRS